MSRTLLFVVEKTFIIAGRGVVLAPGVSNMNQVKSGDTVELLNPEGIRTKHIVKGVEIMSYQLGTPVEKQTHPIVLDVNGIDIPQGTEVWFIHI